MAGWNLIPAFFNALGKSLSNSERARMMGQEEAAANRVDGMVYQQSAPLDRSNFEAASPATTGANLIGDFGGMGKQLFGSAIQGERDMYAPALQAQGAVSDADPWARIYMMYGRAA